MRAWTNVCRLAGVGERSNAWRVCERARGTDNRKEFGQQLGRFEPIKGVKWRDATVNGAPSAFAQEADVALNGLGLASVLVVGARQMMFDTEVSLRRFLEKKGLAQTLQAQFSAATLIEQIGGDCRTKTGSGSARLYRVTLPAKRPLFMRLELPGANNAGPSGTVFTLSVENKPQWAC